MQDNITPCRACERMVERDHLIRTYDCRGIPYRMVCQDCYGKIMDREPGYDGQYYDETDEQIDDDY